MSVIVIEQLVIQGVDLGTFSRETNMAAKKKSRPGNNEMLLRIAAKKTRKLDHMPRCDRPAKNPPNFAEALNYHIGRRGDTIQGLWRAVWRSGERIGPTAMYLWARGEAVPRWDASHKILNRIEARYCLPKGYFQRKIEISNTKAFIRLLGKRRKGEDTPMIDWHLPRDFATRPLVEQNKIAKWVCRNVFAEESDFSKYLKRVNRQPYSVRFSGVLDPLSRYSQGPVAFKRTGQEDIVEAPPRLAAEMKNLVRFKTAELTDLGIERRYYWRVATAEIKVRHYGLVFGSLVASPKRPSVHGFGIDPKKLSFAMFLFPRVWEKILRWRKARRGFFAQPEIQLLCDLRSMAHPEGGWLLQHPELARNLVPIAGFISAGDIHRARKDWKAQCVAAREYAKARLRDIRHAQRFHRDTFEPILPLLDADSPLAGYRKISQELMKWLPSRDDDPVHYAEAIRAYLMFRLGMHLGLRNRNLRELLFCWRGQSMRSEHQLITRGCGELRWSPRRKRWEVFIPYQAFKNSWSTFFSRKPYLGVLENYDNLHVIVAEYLSVHRPILLDGFKDPETFFVRTVRNLRMRNTAAFSDKSFCETWKSAIQRYGIFNPYTGRGAIPGLLPHGPHNVRDVLATHVLKKTGSYELASYAIQSTPESVAVNYGRFFPHDKSARAAEILNREWDKA
jgi:hypothetical protein